jgi:hypothetical protein
MPSSHARRIPAGVFHGESGNESLPIRITTYAEGAFFMELR